VEELRRQLDAEGRRREEQLEANRRSVELLTGELESAGTRLLAAEDAAAVARGDLTAVEAARRVAESVAAGAQASARLGSAHPNSR
jgi:hypothetical protein